MDRSVVINRDDRAAIRALHGQRHVAMVVIGAVVVLDCLQSFLRRGQLASKAFNFLMGFSQVFPQLLR